MNKEAAKKAMEAIRTGVSAAWFLKNDPAERFEGDVLVAAIAFKKHLEREVEAYDGIICGRTLQNARSHTFRELTKPVHKEIKNPCHRCDGTGQMPFNHIRGGVCFKCGGTGRAK